MPIHLLPPEVSAKIAAGEVIERPASVVKELLENAIDAGATAIAVELEEGGVRLIRVRDDGSGIPPAEVELAFGRHATSKLAGPDDLLRIATLGFRGEALPSIAAVADVALLTRVAGADGGYLVHHRGGKPVETGPRAAPPGTTVTVRDLFSDFPARRKFLRAAATETSQCALVTGQYALARPDVAFTLLADGRRLLQSPGTGGVREAAAAVLTRAIATQLLELAAPEGAAPPGGVSVGGLVSPPGVTRASRGGITLVVNGRWVQNRALTFAVQEAYQGLLMTGRHPVAVLQLTVPADEVDVNVHPRKLEVRFRNEGLVYATLQRAVRGTLMASAPDIEFGRPVYAPPAQGSVQQGLAFQAGLAAGPLPPQPSHVAPAAGPEPVRRVPILRVVGQMSSTYIVAEGPDGMYLVDQHAAHERVLFERIAQRLAEAPWDSQGMLEPRVVEPVLEELPLLLNGAELLRGYGFDLAPFGERQLALRALPAGVRDGDVPRLLGELAAGLRAGEEARDRVATLVACHSAVRAGDPLTSDAMRALIADLEACAAPQTCPHGRPTMMHLSAAALEREFGRRG